MSVMRFISAGVAAAIAACWALTAAALGAGNGLGARVYFARKWAGTVLWRDIVMMRGVRNGNVVKVQRTR